MHSLEQRSEYEDMEIPPQNSPQRPNVALSPRVKTEKLLDVNKNIDRDLKPPFNLFREVSLPVIPSAKKLKKERKKGKFKVKREKVRDPPIQDMGSYKKGDFVKDPKETFSRFLESRTSIRQERNQKYLHFSIKWDHLIM